MATIKDCTCDPDTWGYKVPDICEHYEPIMLSTERIITICDICHHDERCHKPMVNIIKNMLDRGNSET